MFNSLFNSLFGKTKEDNNNCSNNNNLDDLRESSVESDFNDPDSNVIAVLLDEDKDWLFVEKEVDDDSNSIEDKEKTPKNLQLVPFKNIFAHLSSISENDENSLLSANLPSLYPNSMDASWILTPPECFSSVSSIQLESSPLENLLIEHPSMSVYYNFHRGPKALVDSVSDVIEDLVVVELTRNDVEEEKTQKVSAKNRDKKNNKKSRSSGNTSNVTLVLMKKNSNPKPQETHKSTMGKSAFDRYNKMQLLRKPKRTTVINQPSQRMMVVSNKRN